MPVAVTNNDLRSGIAILVAIIWGIAALVGMVTRDYTELGIVTPVMMLVGGALFAYRREEGKRNGHYEEVPEKKISRDLSDW